jgi:hypothetical protein
MDCPTSFNEVLKTDQLSQTTNNQKTSSDGPSCEHTENNEEGEREVEGNAETFRVICLCRCDNVTVGADLC